MKQHWTYNYLLAAIGILSLATCTDDYDRVAPPATESPAQGTFTLHVPKKNGVETRGMTEEQEYKIAEIAILAFVNNGSAEELAFYKPIPPPPISCATPTTTKNTP